MTLSGLLYFIVFWEESCKSSPEQPISQLHLYPKDFVAWQTECDDLSVAPGHLSI